MELRRVPYTGSRWVHSLCVPKNETTLYFMSIVDEMQAEYPNCTIDEIMDIVENHDYWTLEEENLPVWSRPPFRPPTPPRSASNDHIDSDDEDERRCECESCFGPFKIDPVEKAELEKTTDETLAMLKENDDHNRDINELCVQVEDTLEWVKDYASNDQKVKIARVLFS